MAAEATGVSARVSTSPAGRWISALGTTNPTGSFEHTSLKAIQQLLSFVFLPLFLTFLTRKTVFFFVFF